MSGEKWAAVAGAAIGAAGIIAAGIIGYQSGTNAVEKDYVQIAVNMLDKKDTSPELRRWAVNVLSDLSPVPFGEKLKQELANKGVYRERVIFNRFEPPPSLIAPCPDFMPKKPPISQDIAAKAWGEYEKCRVQMDLLGEYIKETNALVDKTNASQLKAENEFRQAVGLPELKILPGTRSEK